MTASKSRTTQKNNNVNPLQKLWRTLASLRITVACLFWFFILTFWGTLYQTEFGLFDAQERFFNSLFFLVFKAIPLPGGQLVLWVLFVNLLAAAITRFRVGKSQPGILVIHSGVMFFLVASFVIFHAVEEGNVSLKEGDGTNQASAYHNWELVVWAKDAEEKSGPDDKAKIRISRHMSAYAARHFHRGELLDFDEYGFNARVELYHRNCEAFVQHDGAYEPKPVNRSGIRYLAPIPGFKEPEKNMSGLLLTVLPDEGSPQSVLLFGAEAGPTEITLGGKVYKLELRRKTFQLPFLIELIDFKRELHSGTEIARSYESRVKIHAPGGEREALISMNKPLRYEQFTFYQASFAMGEAGEEFSTLAVVRNSGRLLPYIASFWIFLGFVIHFGQRLIVAIQARKA